MRFAPSSSEPSAHARAWLLAAAALLALLGQRAFDQLSGWLGIALFGAAAVVFALAVPPVTRRPSTAPPGPSVQQWPSRARYAMVAALAATALLFAILDTENVSAAAWIVQAVAIGLVVHAARTADRSFATGPHTTAGSLPRSPIELTTATTQLLLLIVLIGGIWIRFHDLGGIPRGFWFDEADTALLARRIADEGYRPVFGGPVPAYDAYLMALASAVLGESVLAVRTLAAIFGSLTILAGYLVGRELFGKMGGLIIAFLIAFSRWPLTLSRIGMNNVAVPLFALLTLGFVLRGHRRQSHLDFAFAGMAASAGMLFYSALAGSLLAIGLFTTYLAWWGRQPGARIGNHFGTQALVAFTGALVVIAPLAKFVLEDTDRYFGRSRDTALWSDAGLAEDGNIWSALRTSLGRYLPMTSYQGDRNGRHNIPGEPMLPPLVSGLSLLGLGVVAFRIDRWLTALVVLWLPLAFAPGVLSLPWEAPNSLRAVGVQPIMFVLATAAILAAARAIVTSKQTKYALLAVVGVGLGLTGLSDTSSYFDAQRNRNDVWAIHSTAETIAAELAADSPDSTHVLAVAFLRGSRQQAFLSPDREVDGVFGTEAQLPLFVPAGKNALVFALRDSFDLAGQAARIYPNATVQREFDGLVSDLIVVRIPATDIADSLGWTSRGEGNHSAALIIDETGSYQFRLAEPNASLVIDGRAFRPCDVNSTMSLAAGLHIVEVTGSTETPLLQWIEPDSALPWTEVPLDRLVQRDYAAGGLVATHAVGVEPDAPPAFFEVDTALDLRLHEFVLPRPYQTTWSGGLRIDTPGDYEFVLRTDDESTLIIDETTVLENGREFGERSAIVQLDTGVHPIKLRYVDHDGRSEVTLRWRPADQTDEPQQLSGRSLVPWLESRPLSDC